ncbi:cuticle protein LPCP-23-like [Stomoxys calcitrans]|uniref:cuticle protein LPCP-23-like n=1 Tax=Stomoxys calcitrans TaxID=35570 RepID=UPI0027E2A890|nr:cuticle protein LPCP-23-like [Stomoxys calcitrans]
MFKFVAFFACVSMALAAPGLVAEHHTVVQEPVLAKVGTVVHSAPSAVSHQSFTRVHNKAVIEPVVAPVVKTTVHAAPLVPVVKTVEPVVPVVKTVEPVVPVVKTVEHVVPVVKTVAAAPVVHTVAAAPVVHTVAAAPVVQTYHAAPVVSHAVSHQSHVQVHSNAALVAPAVVHAATPVVHSVPLVHSVPVAHEQQQHRYEPQELQHKSSTLEQRHRCGLRLDFCVGIHKCSKLFNIMIMLSDAFIHSKQNTTGHACNDFFEIETWVILLGFLAAAQAAPGLVSQTHSIVQPAVYSAPLVKTLATPVVHTYAAAPVLKTYAAAPVVHTYAAAPVVKTIASPVVHTYAAAPVVKTYAAPVVHTYAAAPVVHLG